LNKHLLTLALAVSAIGGCQHRDTGPKDTGAIEPIPVQSFKREWVADLQMKDDVVDRVILREDLVFAYSKKNVAYVMNRSGGVVRFTAKITDSALPIYEPVVLKDRFVFPTDSTLELYRRDGRFERSYKTTSAPRTNAVGQRDGSRVFFGVDTRNAGRVVAVETLPGDYKAVNQKWELMSDRAAPIYSAPAVNAGILYVGFGEGEVYAVNQDNRQPIWATSTGQTFKTFGPVQADLRADEFGVYVPSTDSKFYCLDKTQGKVKWQYYAGSSLRATPAITATMVYLPVTGRGVVAIDKINGPAVREPKWVVKDAVKLVAEDEKYAYFNRADQIVIAIEKATGEQKFTSKRTDLVAFATNTKDSTIYAASKEGQVLAIVPVLKPGNMGELALEGATRVDVMAMR
jgi:hypothetical protein